MDVAEWKKRYQEVLATVENVYIKSQSEAEKSQKAFSALEKELLKQLEESKNRINELEDQISLYKEKTEQLLKQQETQHVNKHFPSESHNVLLQFYKGLSGVRIEDKGGEFHGEVDVGKLSGLKFTLKENKEFLEYCYQPLYVPSNVTGDFSTSFNFPGDMIVKFLQKLHNTTFE